MLNLQKKTNLELLVKGGFCPNCRSTALAYSEIERGKIFQFKCNECGFKVTSTSDEFREASTSWAQSRRTLDEFIL